MLNESLGLISKIRINQQEFSFRLIEIYTNLVTIQYLILMLEDMLMY